MEAMQLRASVIRLAYHNPTLRQPLLSVLRSAGTLRMAKVERKVLQFFVESAAESVGLDASDARPTRDLEREAAKFEKALASALKEWTRMHPLADDYDVDDLMKSDGFYLVVLTLQGAGRGIWDGDWDHFFNDPRNEIRELERFLERKLGRYVDDTGGGSLNAALEDAAFETAG